MNNIYEWKIYNHQKMDTEDIKNFCMEQVKINGLGEYITDFIIKNIMFGLTSYNEKRRSVCLDTEFIKQYKAYKREFQSKNVLDRILVLDADVFNLFIMEAIYHEIYHAKQKKELKENSDSHYSTLIRASLLFIPQSGSSYNFYHDRYFVEYDAIINSILFIIDYIKDLNIDKRALFLINRSWAFIILKAYGINLENTAYYNEYPSPIDFFRFFFDENFLIHENEKSIIDKLKISISNYEPNNDIDSLIRGYSIPEPFINKLIEIASGKDNTINIFAELNSIAKRNHQKK